MEQKLLVPIGDCKKISPATIVMLKANSNYTLIYLVNGKNFLSSITLGKLEKRLKEFDFFRPTRSTLINLQYISDFKFDGKKNHIKNIQMVNNNEIKVSRRKMKSFENKLRLLPEFERMI